MRAVFVFLALLLLLAPGPLLAAELSSMNAEVQVFRGLQVDTPVPRDVPVSGGASAANSLGEAVPVTGDQLTLEIVQSEARLELPVTMNAQEELQSFNDPASGITLSGGKIAIAVKSADGVEVMTITADVLRVAGASVIATNVRLRSNDLDVDFSDESREIDRVTVSFDVELRSLPQNASAVTSVSKDIGLEARRSFEVIALREGKAVAEIGAVLTVNKTNIDSGVDLGSALITMKIGRAWADKYGQDKIRVMRYGDRGEGQLLETSFAGYEGGQAVFRAASPNGLSSFALTALIPLRAPINWLPIAGAVGGSGVVLASLIFLLRKTRRKEAALRGKWPTGLRREDWRPESKTRRSSRRPR